jgi:hypothetical protein
LQTILSLFVCDVKALWYCACFRTGSPGHSWPLYTLHSMFIYVHVQVHRQLVSTVSSAVRETDNHHSYQQRSTACPAASCPLLFLGAFVKHLWEPLTLPFYIQNLTSDLFSTICHLFGLSTHFILNILDRRV